MSERAVERLVCFFLDEQELGLPIGAVKETIEPRPMARVPLVPDCVAGLINLRGEVVAVLDLARMLGMGERASPDRRVIILRGRTPGQRAAAGVLIDRVSVVRDLDEATLRPVPPTVPSEAAGFFRGLARSGDGDAARPLLI